MNFAAASTIHCDYQHANFRPRIILTLETMSLCQSAVNKHATRVRILDIAEGGVEPAPILRRCLVQGISVPFASGPSRPLATIFQPRSSAKVKTE